MEPLLARLSGKDRLDISDASDLLQFLQNQTESILVSHRNSPAPLGNKPSPAAKNVITSRNCSDLPRSTTVEDPHMMRAHNTSSPVLLSRDRDGGRDLATPPGPSHSLRRIDLSEAKLDINSWSEFPPMYNEQPSLKASKSSEKNKMKSPIAKPGRRITLTPLPSQSPSLSHFPSPNSSGSSWKSNPAFTNHFTSSESAPPSLSEERRLLKEERSKRRHKHGNRTAPPSQRDAGVRKPSTTSTTTYTRDKTGSMSSQRGQQFKSQSATWHHGGSLEENGLDMKISSHSIFELNRSSRGKNTTKNNNSSNSMSRMDSTYNSLSGQRSISTLSAASATSRLPLTSTPLPSRGCGQRLGHTSPSNVTHPDALDLLSGHYATLITGHMLPNLTSEIHFIFQLLTANAPHTPNGQSILGASSNLFESVDNCVYFAVAVLDKIKHLLQCLDRSTLQLLAENPRVIDFNPALSSYFAEVCSVASPNLPPSLGSTNTSGNSARMSFGVPFQEKTDNCRNFPSMKAFHAFKKQRDLFYLVLREWEESHDTPNWSMRTHLGEKIQMLIQHHGEVCSLAHFARLFQRQLVESCKHPLQYEMSTSSKEAVERELAGANGAGSSLVGQLGKTDPQRLMRLTERFFLPSSSVVGPRPPPSFSTMEEFFTDFILTADSYVFNHHLKANLCTELLKLHSGCGSLHPKDVADTIYTMQSLAKFLGFLHFLPYRKPIPDSIIQTRELVPEPLPLVQCVFESCDHGHLCVTTLWVVSYVSMMDSHAHKLTHVSNLITTLIDIYRSVSFREEMSSRTRLLIATTLGWLFETPQFPSTLFFDHVKTHPSPSPSLPHTPDSLDSSDVISVDLLYSCCHYLGEFRSLLAGFAAGQQPKASPMRKITPISTDIEWMESNPAKQLQVQLRENFFRSHPAYLKQLCDVTSERVSASAIAHCESKLLPETAAGGVRRMTRWMREKCSLVGVASEDDKLKEPFTQSDVEREICQIIFETSQVAMEKVDSYVASFCRQQTSKALEALLTGSLSDQVVQTASEIAGEWAKEKCLKWSTEKLRDIVREELTKAFEKAKRTLKAVLKVKDSQTNITSSLNQRGGQRCDMIGRFASNVSSKEAAQSPEVDLDSSMKIIKEQIEGFLSEDNSHSLLDCLPVLHGSLECLCRQVYLSAFVTPQVPVPQALSAGLSEQVLSLSTDLAVLLVCQGMLTRQKYVSSDGQMNGNLLDKLLLYWKLMKNLKLEMPIYKLLNEVAFTKYFNSGNPLVWVCLSDIIVGVVEEKITSSSVVEGLWMCRTHQLKDDQITTFYKAVAVFLETWYSQDNTLSSHSISAPSGDGRTLSPSPSLSMQSAPSTQTVSASITYHTCSPSPSSSQPPSTCTQTPQAVSASVAYHTLSPSPSPSLSRTTFKEIHFVRLLSIVLTQLDSGDIPTSLMSHKLSHLSSVVRHEARN